MSHISGLEQGLISGLVILRKGLSHLIDPHGWLRVFINNKQTLLWLYTLNKNAFNSTNGGKIR